LHVLCENLRHCTLLWQCSIGYMPEVDDAQSCLESAMLFLFCGILIRASWVALR
jgi:hypothetical protein